MVASWQLGAYQDLGAKPPDAERMLECIQRLRTADGSYANHHGASVGLTPATAAAATMLRNLGQPVARGVAEWLLARLPRTGRFPGGAGCSDTRLVVDLHGTTRAEWTPR